MIRRSLELLSLKWVKKGVRILGLDWRIAVLMILVFVFGKNEKVFKVCSFSSKCYENQSNFVFSVWDKMIFDQEDVISLTVEFLSMNQHFSAFLAFGLPMIKPEASLTKVVINGNFQYVFFKDYFSLFLETFFDASAVCLRTRTNLIKDATLLTNETTFIFISLIFVETLLMKDCQLWRCL